MREKVVVLPVLLLLILSLVPLLGGWDLPDEVAVSEQVIEPQKKYSNSYVVHSPIDIDRNSDFETLGFPGNGSESNPYRIENLNITGTFYSIIITNVSVYYVISNCYLKNANTMWAVVLLESAPKQRDIIMKSWQHFVLQKKQKISLKNIIIVLKISVH